MESASPKRRVMWGFVLSPIPGLLIFILSLCTLAHSGVLGTETAGFGECLVGGIAVYGIGGSPIAYAGMIVFGLPLYELFHRQRWLQWWQIGLGGMLAGLLTGSVLSAAAGTVGWYNVILVGVGLVSGLFFWRVALFQSRPNNGMQSPAVGRG